MPQALAQLDALAWAEPPAAVAVRLDACERLDPDLLKRAQGRLVERHEALRLERGSGAWRRG
jgi:hypothetical protein